MKRIRPDCLPLASALIGPDPRLNAFRLLSRGSSFFRVRSEPPMRRSLLALAAVLALSAAPPRAADAAKPTLTTQAERSGYKQTGRYDEVIALCDAYQKAWPAAVRCFDFGTSPQGRPMKAMAVSTSGALTAEEARARNLP